MASAGHLVRRFLGSLSTRPPPADDEAWARAQLLPAEQAVWARMSSVDRRHAVGVAHRVVAGAEPAPPRPVVAAALLHDCGKTDSGLGTFERVGATVWITVVGRARAGTGDSRIARYTRHEPIGAEMLRAAGSDPVTVALVAGSPDAPAASLALLRAADDAV